MSILRHFNKHHGWYNGKRTPFGGGNPLSVITDPISSALGTDGGGGGLLGGLADIDPGPAIGDALASVDPGPAIGAGLADVDKFVGREIPGGWTTVGAAALAGTGLYFAPELMAALGAEGVAGSQATFLAADAANLAANGLSQAAIAQNLAIGYGLSAEAAAAAASAAVGTVGEFGASAVSKALPYSETFDAYNLAQQGLSSGAIEQNLAATGLDKFLAADMANMAASGLSPEAIAQNLAYSYSPAELAGTGITSLQAQSGMSASEALRNANRARSIAKALNQGGSQAGKNISAKNIPTANQWSQQAAQNMALATPEQFGGLYQMNQNPFVFTNPLAAALKNKDSTGFDVSGTGGTTLQPANLAKLLA
jgi:hypothetical protein